MSTKFYSPISWLPNRLRSRLTALAAALLLAPAAWAQAPANDNCTGAIALTAGTTCTVTTGTNLNATASGTTAPPCGGTTASNDVWYSIVVPTGGAVTVTTSAVTGSPFTDSVLELFSGTCTGLTSIGCNDDATGTYSAVTATGLTVGSTIYARVFSYGTTAAGQFGICATTPAATPANDNPAGAITLTLSATCTPVNGTNAAATTTTPSGYTNPGAAPFNCGIAASPKDVWYKFTTAASGAGSTSASIQVTGNPAGYIRAFSAASATGPFTEIGCASGGANNVVSAPLNLTGLTANTTYYVSIAGYGSSDTQGAFTICASSTAAVVCTAPTAVTVGSITTTSASIAFTAGAGNTSYTVTYYPTATPTATTTVTPTPTASPVALTGLTPNTAYTVTIQPLCSAGGTTGLITRTFTTLGPPPANDDCTGAIALTVSTTCTVTTVSNANATASTASAPSCGGTVANNDIWYSLVVPANGTVTVTTSAVTGSPFTDSVVELYSGTCTGLTSVGCNDDATGTYSAVTATGLTAGSTIYARVFSYGSTATGQFGICATTPAPLPANDAAVQIIYSLGTVSPTYASPVTVQAIVRNAGSTALTNIPVTLTVSGATTFTDIKLVAALAVGASTTVTFTAFPVTATSGTNTLTVTVPADGLATNNTQTSSQAISASTLSYVSGTTFAGGAGVAAANSIIAVRYQSAGNASVRTITPTFTSGTANTFQVQVYSATATGPGTLLYTSPTQTRAAAGGAIPVAIPGVNVNGGFFVAIKSIAATNIGIAYQTEVPLRAGTFFFTTDGTTWIDINTQTLNSRLAIDVTMGAVLSNKDAIGAGTLSVFPNPAHQNFTLRLPAIAGQRTAQLTLINTLGQQVQTRTVQLNAAGTDAQVDVSSLAKGIYTLRVQTADQVAAKQVVVE